MKYERASLENLLKRLQPALFSKDLIEELTCFWLDGERIFAFDGELGISSPLKSKVKGGVKGVTLLGLTKKTKADEIELLTETTDRVTLRSGKNEADLPLLNSKRQPAWPAMTEVAQPVEVTPQLIAAVKAAMGAVSFNENRPDFLGITFIPQDTEIDVFAGDGPTATWLICEPMPEHWPERRFAWPHRFCKQLVKQGEDGTLHITDDNVLLICKDGTEVLGRSLVIESPVDFTNMMNRVLPEGYLKKLYPVPEGLKASLEQVGVVQKKQTEDTVVVEITGKKMKLWLETGRGKVLGELTIDGKQEEAAVRISPLYLKRSLAHADHMYVFPTCILMVGWATGFLHVISTQSVPRN